MNPVNKVREALRISGMKIKMLKGATKAVVSFKNGSIEIENPVVLDIGGKLNIDGKRVVLGEIEKEEVV